MTNWIEHDGGPQPVAYDTWIEVEGNPVAPDSGLACGFEWHNPCRYRILNQHLIDAALKRGIELGLEAAADKLAERQDRDLSEILHIDPDTIAKEAQRD